mgnify:CR=1 FL=1
MLDRLWLSLVLLLDQAIRSLAITLSALGLRLPSRLMARILTRGIAARLMPASLAMAARGRRIVLVTGTNGKTTTTALLAAALGGEVATNTGNHNFYCGLLDALLASSAPVAVLEVDELWLPDVLRWLRPDLLLVLNLLEDAWRRTPDPTFVSECWRSCVDGSRIPILAWAEDPALVSLFADQPVHWIGQRDAGPREVQWQACPACGGLLRRQGHDWSCGCGLRHPAARWQLSADGSRLDTPTAARLRVEPGLPGRINRRNAAFATAAAVLLGEQPQVVHERLQRFRQLPLRDHRYRLAGRDVHLLIAKNPDGWLVLLDRLEPGQGLMLLQQHSAATLDLSWIYDIPVDALRGRSIGLCGAHALDLAVWLTYAQVDFITAADPRDLVPRMPAGPLLCLSDLLGAYLIASIAE